MGSGLHWRAAIHAGYRWLSCEAAATDMLSLMTRSTAGCLIRYRTGSIQPLINALDCWEHCALLQFVEEIGFVLLLRGATHTIDPSILP